MQRIKYTVVEGDCEMSSETVLLTQVEIDQLKDVIDDEDETVAILEHKDLVVPKRTFHSLYEVLAEIKALETQGQDQANCKARAIIMVQAIIAHIEDSPDPHSGGHGHSTRGKGGRGHGRGGHGDHTGYVRVALHISKSRRGSGSLISFSRSCDTDKFECPSCSSRVCHSKYVSFCTACKSVQLRSCTHLRKSASATLTFEVT